MNVIEEAKRDAESGLRRAESAAKEMGRLLDRLSAENVDLRVRVGSNPALCIFGAKRAGRRMECRYSKPYVACTWPDCCEISCLEPKEG